MYLLINLIITMIVLSPYGLTGQLEFTPEKVSIIIGAMFLFWLIAKTILKTIIASILFLTLGLGYFIAKDSGVDFSSDMTINENIELIKENISKRHEQLKEYGKDKLAIKIDELN